VQDIEGALDLDVLPAMNGKTITAGRIWCAPGTSVKTVVTIDRTGWDGNAKVDVALVAPDATQATLSVNSTSAAVAELQAKATQEGFHSLEITANGLPTANSTPAYKLSVSYSAPQTFMATNRRLLP
jgi:hypothetical protein